MSTVRFLEVVAGNGGGGGGGWHLCVVGLAEFSLLFVGQIVFDERTKIRQGAAELFGEKSAVVVVFIL